MNKKSLLCVGALVLLVSGCSKKAEEKAAGVNISGTIQIDPSLSRLTAGKDIIYLIAKRAEGGPPVAVVKFIGKNYPYAFTITKDNLMMAEETLDAPLNLTVRVDKDGDAMTKTPGDLLGEYEKNPVSIREENVTIKVKEVLK